MDAVAENQKIEKVLKTSGWCSTLFGCLALIGWRSLTTQFLGLLLEDAGFPILFGLGFLFVGFSFVGLGYQHARFAKFFSVTTLGLGVLLLVSCVYDFSSVDPSNYSIKPLFGGISRADSWARFLVGVSMVLMGIWTRRFPITESNSKRITFSLAVGSIMIFDGFRCFAENTMWSPISEDSTAVTFYAIGLGQLFLGGVVLYISRIEQGQWIGPRLWSWILLPLGVWLFMGTLAIVATSIGRSSSQTPSLPWMVLLSGSSIAFLLIWAYWLAQATLTTGLELENKNRALNAEIEHRSLMEQELRTMQEVLEVKVAERTEQLTRSNQELEQFAYISSHDLQEPLRKVSNYLDLMTLHMKGDVGAQVQRDIDHIVKAVTQMKMLLNELMGLLRVQHDTSPLENIPLEEEVRLVLDELDRAEDVIIKVDPLPEVYGNRLRLRQLFQNLISNAIKFRGPEKPNILISAHQQGSSWVISIRDNGIGIEPTEKDRIFEIFERLRPREFPGTGMGLAICRKIVESHGGTIWVDSAPGYGSTFRFTLLLPKEVAVGKEVDKVAVS